MTAALTLIIIFFCSCYCLEDSHNLRSDGSYECKDNSYLLDGSCYGLVYHNEDWDESFERCQLTGGRMAVIRNEKIFKFLYKLLQWEIHFDYWIGVRKVDNEWRYMNDRPVNVDSVWAPGQPDNQGIGATGSCVALSVNHYLLWDDEPCDYKYLHVCQYRNDTTGPCDEQFNGSCYHLHNERLSFPDAERKCEENGGLLAAPASREEHDFITDLITKSRRRADINTITTDAILRTPLWVTNVRSPWNKRDSVGGSLPRRPEEFTRCLYISTRGLGINCKIVASPICQYPVLPQPTEMETTTEVATSSATEIPEEVTVDTTRQEDNTTSFLTT